MTTLFEGQRVRLAALDPAADAAAFARWSRDSEYNQLLSSDPARPLTARASQTGLEKDLDHAGGCLFAVRTLADDQLIGFVGLDGLEARDARAWAAIGLGERQRWGQGLGTEAMRLILRYAFDELNLHCVSLTVFDYNQRALRSYEKIGFVAEGRVRQRLRRLGRRWDMIVMSMLRPDWEAAKNKGEI